MRHNYLFYSSCISWSMIYANDVQGVFRHTETVNSYFGHCSDQQLTCLQGEEYHKHTLNYIPTQDLAFFCITVNYRNESYWLRCYLKSHPQVVFLSQEASLELQQMRSILATFLPLPESAFNLPARKALTGRYSDRVSREFFACRAEGGSLNDGDITEDLLQVKIHCSQASRGCWFVQRIFSCSWNCNLHLNTHHYQDGILSRHRCIPFWRGTPEIHLLSLALRAKYLYPLELQGESTVKMFLDSYRA